MALDLSKYARFVVSVYDVIGEEAFVLPSDTVFVDEKETVPVPGRIYRVVDHKGNPGWMLGDVLLQGELKVARVIGGVVAINITTDRNAHKRKGPDLSGPG
jgi:hypothetical protein